MGADRLDFWFEETCSECRGLRGRIDTQDGQGVFIGCAACEGVGTTTANRPRTARGQNHGADQVLLLGANRC